MYRAPSACARGTSRSSRACRRGFRGSTQITRDRLRRVDDFEDGLRALGFRQLRVRFHDAIARLEVDADELPRIVAPGVRDAVVALGKRLGFAYIAIDLAGFRSGSLNEVLPADALVQIGQHRRGGA